MPDKHFHSGNNKKGCGKSCVRCWRNKLKHGNKLKKKNFPKQNVTGSFQNNIFDDQVKEKIHPYIKWGTSEHTKNSNFDEWFKNYVRIPTVYEQDSAAYIPLDRLFVCYREWLSETKKIHTQNITRFRRQLNSTYIRPWEKNKAYQLILIPEK